MSDIPMIWELVDAYEKGELKEEGKLYPCYLTTRHRDTKSTCWTYDSQFKGLLEWRKTSREIDVAVMWGVNPGEKIYSFKENKDESTDNSPRDCKEK